MHADGNECARLPTGAGKLGEDRRDYLRELFGVEGVLGGAQHGGLYAGDVGVRAPALRLVLARQAGGGAVEGRWNVQLLPPVLAGVSIGASAVWAKKNLA